MGFSSTTQEGREGRQAVPRSARGASLRKWGGAYVSPLEGEVGRGRKGRVLVVLVLLLVVVFFVAMHWVFYLFTTKLDNYELSRTYRKLSLLSLLLLGRFFVVVRFVFKLCVPRNLDTTRYELSHTYQKLELLNCLV